MAAFENLNSVINDDAVKTFKVHFDSIMTFQTGLIMDLPRRVLLVAAASTVRIGKEQKLQDQQQTINRRQQTTGKTE